MDREEEKEDPKPQQPGGGGSGGEDNDQNGTADWAEAYDAEIAAMYGYDGGKSGTTLIGKWVKTTTTTEGHEVVVDYTRGQETEWEEGTTTTSYDYVYNLDYEPQISFNPLTQSGNPLEQFANSLFGDKVGSIRGNLRGPLNFVIDDKGAETNYDPTTKRGMAGITSGNRQGITVYIDSDVMGDFDRLYVFLAHELEHAFNISDGSRGAWYNTYGPVMSSNLSEASAYQVGAQAANGLGLPYDFGQQSQQIEQATQFLTGFYNR